MKALICYLIASHGERLDEYVDSSLFYKYPDAYRFTFFLKVWFFGNTFCRHSFYGILSRSKDKGGLISAISLYMFASTEMLSNRKGRKQNV